MISPTGSGYAFAPAITITSATAGATILYALGPLFSTTVPTTWETWNPASPPEVLDSRLWARATASGLTDSSPVWEDYWYEASPWQNQPYSTP